MPAITGTVLMNMGKQLLKKMAKKTAKATLKKKKVKGKDVAKKMMGKEDKGGALVLQPKAELVPSPGGKIDLANSKETGGDIVKVSGTAARELGLNNFMESINGVKESVKSIKDALNEKSEDVQERIEKQRLLNAKLKKEEREKGLESKGSGIGKKLLGKVKDPAEGFLARMARFAAMTILGSLIAALMGNARDVVLAFRIGIEALKKGLPTLLKGIKALQSGIGKSFKVALKPFKALGTAVLEGFKTIGSKLFGWVSKSISNITQGIKNFGKNFVQTGGKILKPIANVVGNTVTRGKEFVKNTASKAKNFVKNTAKNVGSKIKNVAQPVVSRVKDVAKTVGGKLGKVGKFIGKLFGKQAGKAAAGPGIKTLFKAMAKGAKAIKIPVVGPLLVALMSMFAGDPMKQTLFKTAGAAIGGGLGLALGPIGMIVGEIAGEFVGDVLYTGFSGEAGGWKAAGKKLKDKFMQILSGGKKVMNWFKNSIGRIKWRKLTFAPWKEKAGILKDAFFPPAEMAESKPNTDAEDVSQSASYEDGGEDTTVVVDAGGEESSAPSSQSGKNKLIPLVVDKQTILNSQYEMSSNAALYKV